VSILKFVFLFFICIGYECTRGPNFSLHWRKWALCLRFESATIKPNHVSASFQCFRVRVSSPIASIGELWELLGI